MTVAMKFDELREEGLAEGRKQGLAEGHTKGKEENKRIKVGNGELRAFL